MQLHEQTQRFILLLIFYLFGPILTLGIIGGIALRKLPSNARSWERNLTQQTGLHWSIQSIEYCSPELVRLKEVKILDDTAQLPLFHARQIEVQLVTDTPREKIFPGISATAKTEHTGLTALLTRSFPSFRSADRFWRISVPFAIVNFSKYSSEESALLLQKMLDRVFARFDTLSEVPVQFVFDQIAVVSEYSLKKEGDKNEDKVDIFRFVQGNIYRTPEEIRSDWSFQIKDVSEFDRQHLSFILSLNDTLDISFRTEKQPIPCDLAAVFYAPFKHFSGGTFQGEWVLSTRSVNNSHTVRLNQVIFTNVPLAPLVREYTDFSIEGTVADLRLDRAVFGTEGTYAEGSFQIIDGALDNALFHRCVDHFRLTVEPQHILDAPTRQIPFTACAIHFRLQPEGIDFWADHIWRDVLMHYKEERSTHSLWQVRFPVDRRPVTYHELMSIFASDGAPVVPLTPGLRSVLQHIPVQ